MRLARAGSRKDYNEFGYEFGTAGSRLRDLREAMPILKERMTKEVPQPVRNPIPIMIGGGGEKVTLKIVAEYADLWNGFGPPETWIHKNNVLTNWCEEVGRNPDDVERTVSLNRDDDIPGNLDAYLEAGATHFIHMSPVDIDREKVEQLVAWRDKVNG